MNRIILAIVLLFTATSLAPRQSADSDEEHRKWIASVIESTQTIKPGMTREDLLKVFATEGGLSNRMHRTYVYKQCPYIKVTVDFEAATNADDVLTEMSEDRIVNISAPFLQYSVMD
jgi:hypothetical protein